LHEQFGRQFASLDKYMDRLGEESRVGNERATQGVRVVARKMQEYVGS
jgi:hypothetical protein